MAKISCCQECGGALSAPGQNRKNPASKKFCTPAHRMAFNNRRRDRGAELYDLFMNLRFNRAEAAEKNVWTLMCNQAGSYNDADKARRDGRASYQTIQDALDALPLYRSATAGDNR